VTLSGGQKPAVRIQVNPARVAANGLTMEDVRAAVAAANVNQAKGSLDGPLQSFTIAANDQIHQSHQYRALVIAYRNNAPLLLSDVAEVIDGAENIRQAAWMGDQPAIIVNIQRQPGANLIEVVDRVKQLLPQLQSALPTAVQVTVLTDRTTTIRASVHDVQFELMLAVVLVVLVIFVFLRSAAATFIPGITVPVSIVGTFAVMYGLGFSLNNLSLMALTISTGFVVDDAVVMIENITRHIEEGESPLLVAFYGRTLRWVLGHQTGTLLVAIGTLVLTLWLYVQMPKGLFPIQDTGVILGISEAPQNISFDAMADRQQALGREILQDHAVASISSFIGIDGTNATLNSGRIQITLTPLAERGESVGDVISRLRLALAKVDGITLYLQPVQDLTVENRVSRTQFQYSLEDPDEEELRAWAPKFVARLRELPELHDVATDQLDQGLQARVQIDRATASRLGITPQMIVDALYNAFGQRQISTVFTQLNQYR